MGFQPEFNEKIFYNRAYFEKGIRIIAVDPEVQFEISSEDGDKLFTIDPSGIVSKDGIKPPTIVYDHTVSGLSAITVQEAIDELALGVGPGPGNAFIQDGNSFGATGVLGTLDQNNLNIVANNILIATAHADTNWNVFEVAKQVKISSFALNLPNGSQYGTSLDLSQILPAGDYKLIKANIILDFNAPVNTVTGEEWNVATGNSTTDPISTVALKNLNFTHAGSGQISEVTGIAISSATDTTTGDILKNCALSIRNGTHQTGGEGGGEITDNIGIEVKNPFLHAQITNQYGILIRDQIVSGEEFSDVVPTNHYSVYAEGGSDTAFFQGNMGIGSGTTSPKGFYDEPVTLEIAGPAALHVADDSLIQLVSISGVYPGTSGQIGIRSRMEANPASSGTSAVTGGMIEALTTYQNDKNLTGLIGLQILCEHDGYGTMNGSVGLVVKSVAASDDATPGSGSITANKAIDVQAVSDTTAATITTNYGINLTSGPSGSTVVGDNYGIKSWAGTFFPGTTITNNYGIYILPQSDADNDITNNYGLYIAGMAHVAATFQSAIYVADQALPGDPYTYAIYTNGGRHYFKGDVGIGVAGTTHQLELSDDDAVKPTTNTWTIASDIRIKENISPFVDGLPTLLKLSPVQYELNGRAGTVKGTPGIGLIAQEAKDHIPYTVSKFKAKLEPEDEKETELLNFNSHALTFVLINAVKEMADEIKKLSSRVFELERK